MAPCFKALILASMAVITINGGKDKALTDQLRQGYQLLTDIP